MFCHLDVPPHQAYQLPQAPQPLNHHHQICAAYNDMMQSAF